MYQPPYALKIPLALYRHMVFSDTASTQTAVTEQRNALLIVFINGSKVAIKLQTRLSLEFFLATEV